MTTTTLDAIGLELLRQRLDAITFEGGETIRRTTVSPLVSEGDYSVTILDADGTLLTGSWASTNVVLATMERFGDDIAEGDVFLSNDPHSGGGNHPSDVVVQRPVFIDQQLVAWVALQCHVMDIGGMKPGTWTPDATECYQESLRIPPVRIVQRGVESRDVWSIILNNIRVAVQGEMDLRSLISGANVAVGSVADVARDLGSDVFSWGVSEIVARSERAFRQRFESLADGEYFATNWAEWGDEFFRVPCHLTVVGDRLVFDYEGAAPQAPHFFNSKHYIIENSIVGTLRALLAPDVPLNAGTLRAVEVRCPVGSVVNSITPAPIQAAHVHINYVANDAAAECIRMALAASPDAPQHRFLTGRNAGVATGNSSWPHLDADGMIDVFTRPECAVVGASGGQGRDGGDGITTLVGPTNRFGGQDIEVWEERYPVLMSVRERRVSVGGAGEFRSGQSFRYLWRPHGIDSMTGMTWGTRVRQPVMGAAGGMPGDTIEYLHHRHDGTVVHVPAQIDGFHLRDDEWMEGRNATGGGFGDPLDRDAELVALDVATDRLTVDEALEAYGVVIGDSGVDAVASAQVRDERRRQRLAAAQPAARPVGDVALDENAPVLPLYPGVVQRGNLAVAERTGVVLAVAPDHWTDGCPTIEAPWPADAGVSVRTYLDPSCGRSLFVEVTPAGEARSWSTAPRRWTDAGEAR